MKHRGYKLAAFILMVVFLCGATVGFAELPCAHTNKVQFGRDLGIPLQYPEAHWIPYWNLYTCQDCGKSVRDKECGYIVEGHSFYKDTANSGHDGIKGKHRHTYVCYPCNYNYVIELDCDGPPCVEYLGIVRDYITE